MAYTRGELSEQTSGSSPRLLPKCRNTGAAVFLAAAAIAVFSRGEKQTSASSSPGFEGQGQRDARAAQKNGGATGQGGWQRRGGRGVFLGWLSQGEEVDLLLVEIGR